MQSVYTTATRNCYTQASQPASLLHSYRYTISTCNSQTHKRAFFLDFPTQSQQQGRLQANIRALAIWCQQQQPREELLVLAGWLDGCYPKENSFITYFCLFFLLLLLFPGASLYSTPAAGQLADWPRCLAPFHSELVSFFLSFLFFFLLSLSFQKACTVSSSQLVTGEKKKKKEQKKPVFSNLITSISTVCCMLVLASWLGVAACLAGC